VRPGQAHDQMATLREAAAEMTANLRDLMDPRAARANLDPVGLSESFGEAARALAARPLPAVNAAVEFATGSGRAALAAALRGVGQDADGPAQLPAKDRRYADPAWETNPWYFLCRQGHALFAGYLEELTAGLALSPQARRKIDFAVRQTVEATAPVNWPWSNPTMVKKAFDTGGLSLLRGARNLARDALTNRGLPRQVIPGTHVVGQDLAATPGKVVYRNRLMELIQYEPQTEQVHEIPLLMSPPWINKFYIMDLAPGKSLVEWAVQHGHTVFMISYRNPDSDMRDVTMSDYLREGPLAALDVVQEITGADKVNVAALCLGGTLATAMCAWLATRGDDRVNSLTLMNTLLDFTLPGQLGVFTDEQTVNRLEKSMEKSGYLPSSSMKTTFDMLRATDLLWNYVISGWMLGEDPAPFDMLSWNSDSTRMPAAMQAEYLRALYLENQFAEGKLELAGERLDVAMVKQDTYVVTAESDHIAPWQGVYVGAAKLGGTVRFVMSNSGHIAGVVNPPSPKSKHWYGESAQLPQDPAKWRKAAHESAKSWWEDWSPWVGERAGGKRTPPSTGSATHPVLVDAPGSYVFLG